MKIKSFAKSVILGLLVATTLFSTLSHAAPTRALIKGLFYDDQTQEFSTERKEIEFQNLVSNLNSIHKFVRTKQRNGATQSIIRQTIVSIIFALRDNDITDLYQALGLATALNDIVWAGAREDNGKLEPELKHLFIWSVDGEDTVVESIEAAADSLSYEDDKTAGFSRFDVQYFGDVATSLSTALVELKLASDALAIRKTQ